MHAGGARCTTSAGARMGIRSSRSASRTSSGTGRTTSTTTSAAAARSARRRTRSTSRRRWRCPASTAARLSGTAATRGGVVGHARSRPARSRSTPSTGPRTDTSAVVAASSVEVHRPQRVAVDERPIQRQRERTIASVIGARARLCKKRRRVCEPVLAWGGLPGGCAAQCGDHRRRDCVRPRDLAFDRERDRGDWGDSRRRELDQPVPRSPAFEVAACLTSTSA